MASVKDKIRAQLQTALSPLHMVLTDDSDRHLGHPGALASGGGHFELTVVSEKFRGLNSLQRHRLIYQVLATEMKSDIHALTIQAHSPEEWK